MIRVEEKEGTIETGHGINIRERPARYSTITHLHHPLQSGHQPGQHTRLHKAKSSRANSLRSPRSFLARLVELVPRPRWALYGRALRLRHISVWLVDLAKPHL